jgi:hypothetical protein
LIMDFYNLTQRQSELLDKLWAFQTRDELELWRETLNHDDYLMSITLQNMMIYEFIDLNLGDYVDDAQEVIDRIAFK